MVAIEAKVCYSRLQSPACKEMNEMTASHLPQTIKAYLQRRAVDQWQIKAVPGAAYVGAIVIPALAEGANLPAMLLSLSNNPPALLERFLLLVVVNQRADASTAESADNQAVLAALPEWRQQFGLQNLAWVDAATPGCALPAKQGVGLARKIGLDLALSHLDYAAGDPLLVCLDADTIVQPDYLSAIVRHFATATAGGASIPYCHQPAADPAGQAVIDRYELFLRAYVLGLELAGSPYAFHTVGSAMACRATAYVAAGGMNKRLAGEDFYFLQQIHKVCGVATLTGTVVHPSPRASQRVPFGTGRAVGDMLADGEAQFMFYQPELFRLLGEWLGLVHEQIELVGNDLLAAAGRISPHLHGFLVQADFATAWDNLKRHNPTRERLLTAFHGWFDAFRTMRLLHHLTDAAYPRIQPTDAVAPLLARAGHAGVITINEQLVLLRRLQGTMNCG
jgi:hypothetical protein